MIQGTFNQIVKASGRYGGARVVFEGHPQLIIGGFNFDMNSLPAPGVVLPCGTPIYGVTETRTAYPIITAKVVSVSSTTVTVEDCGWGQTAIPVGATVAELPSNLTTAATDYATVSAVNGNEITLSAAITGLAANDVLVVVDATSKKVKGAPTGLLPYDVVRDPNAISVDCDIMIGNDRPVLTRRMPPINDAIKNSVQSNGHKIVFSARK